MLWRKYGTFTGGIDLPDEKRPTLDSPICPWGPIERLTVPLAPCGGRAAESVVKAEEKVIAGQMLGRAAGPDAIDVFSPVAGRVAGNVTAMLAGRHGFVQTPAVEIRDIAATPAIEAAEQTFDWQAADPQALRGGLAEGQLAVCRRPSVPLAQWVERSVRGNCLTLIANVMEGQPYVTADHRLLVEHGTEVIRGLAVLARAIGAEQVMLAADQRRTDAYRELVAPARMYRIQRIALPHKYPMGADAVLVKVLARREVPPGGGPQDVGVAVIDAATCFAAYRWAACGQRQTARVVTVGGERAERSGNFWLPFGVPCELLAGKASPPIIHGGPMVGMECEPHCVIGPAADAVLAIDADVPATPSPCIRCGWCTDHCPARLNVAALNDNFELGRIRRSQKALAMACVECGCCSYVCPARLPLSQRVRQLKRAITSARRHATSSAAEEA